MGVLRSRAEGAEAAAAAREAEAAQLERDNRRLRDQIKAMVSQLEGLAALQQRSSTAAAASAAAAAGPPSSSASAQGRAGDAWPLAAARSGGEVGEGGVAGGDEVVGQVLERYRELRHELRAAQASLAGVEARGEGAEARARQAEQHVAQLQGALAAAVAQVKRQEEARAAALLGAGKAAQQDKVRAPLFPADYLLTGGTAAAPSCPQEPSTCSCLRMVLVAAAPGGRVC